MLSEKRSEAEKVYVCQCCLSSGKKLCSHKVYVKMKSHFVTSLHFFLHIFEFLSVQICAYLAIIFA